MLYEYIERNRDATSYIFGLYKAVNASAGFYIGMRGNVLESWFKFSGLGFEVQGLNIKRKMACKLGIVSGYAGGNRRSLWLPH